MRFFLPWLLALPCIAIEFLTKWVGFPLSKQLKGSQFHLLVYSPERQHVSLLSYGVAAVGLMAAAAFLSSVRAYRLLCWTGAALIWLSVFSILQVAWTDAPLLKELSWEWNQEQAIAAFTQKTLPQNLDEEPSAWNALSLDTISDRLVAGWYFVRFAGWSALVAGLAALGVGLHGERRASMAWLTAGGVAALLCVCGARPAIAQMLVARGQVAEAQGEPDKAISSYRRAMRLDRWNALNSFLYERIGAVDASYRRTSTIEYGMYHAAMASTQVDMSKAISEVSALISRAPEPLAGVLRRRTAEFLVQDAQVQHRRGAYGIAVIDCEKALQFEPRSFVAPYFLSRDYYLTGAYYRAIDITEAVLKRVDDPITRSNLCSNLGDAYTKINAFSEAKLAYRQSYQLDYIINRRALSALTGE